MKQYINYAETLKTTLPNLESEKELAFDDEWNTVGWWDDNCFQKGKLDVFEKQDNRAIIVDHKTGKYSSYSLENYLGEMRYFSLLTMKADPEIDKIKTVITWLQNDSTPTTRIYTRDDVVKIENEFENKINIIEQAVDNETFQCKPSGLCSYCGKMDCKYRKERKK